jgi:hypothetical protein
MPDRPSPARDPYATTTSGATPRVARALDAARDDARTFEKDPVAALARVAAAAPKSDASPPARPPRTFAIGDPQAPLARFLEILDRHGLLGDDGRLAAAAHLVSMGDHFDWGLPEERAFAAESAFALLAWLGAHPAARVSILLGNHDLARVGELAPFDDATFARVRDEALALRGTPMSAPGRAERRQAFLARHPTLPGVGVAARDFSTFEARQRRLVEALVDAGRMRPAFAHDDRLLLVHAPLTVQDLALVSAASDASARAVAAAIGHAFASAWSAWDRASPLTLGDFYRPGSAATGEARGVFVQRPADPTRGDPALFMGPPRRRFHPRELPAGLAQVVGHIRDHKCRELMPAWSEGPPAHDGPVRHLRVDGDRVRYRAGGPPDDALARATEGREALVVFADGGMNHAPPARYELFDLDARRAVTPPA